MAAYFTIERMALSIKSVEDLVGQTEVDYGTVKDGATWNFLKVKFRKYKTKNLLIKFLALDHTNNSNFFQRIVHLE